MGLRESKRASVLGGIGVLSRGAVCGVFTGGVVIVCFISGVEVFKFTDSSSLSVLILAFLFLRAACLCNDCGVSGVFEIFEV